MSQITYHEQLLSDEAPFASQLLLESHLDSLQLVLLSFLHLLLGVLLLLMRVHLLILGCNPGWGQGRRLSTFPLLPVIILHLLAAPHHLPLCVVHQLVFD